LIGPSRLVPACLLLATTLGTMPLALPVTLLPADAQPATSQPASKAILAGADPADSHAAGTAQFYREPVTTVRSAPPAPDSVILAAEPISVTPADPGTAIVPVDPAIPVAQTNLVPPVARVGPATPSAPEVPSTRPKPLVHRGDARPPAGAAVPTKHTAVISRSLHAVPQPARAPADVASSTPLSSGEALAVHVVAAGETLWSISQAAQISVGALARTNQLSERRPLHPGQLLTIPAAAIGAVPVLPRAAAAHVAAYSHRIAAGETLWQIARDGGIDVAVLAAANHLTENSPLRIGQVVTVPPPGTRLPGSVQAVSSPSLRDRTAIAALPASGGTGTRTGAYRFGMVWPSGGIVSSRFGWRLHPIFGTREFHTGVDIATRWGSPVLAARDGIVQFVGWMTGYGRLVVMNHGNGLVTFYSHLSAAVVAYGQRVSQGQIIGRIGSTGWSTGPHLFFEVRRDGVPVDPTRYLR
jgi:murein DD-endopeptidase MepM/ murein hydrolase activator NlpD